jgi:hypothetical protein
MKKTNKETSARWVLTDLTHCHAVALLLLLDDVVAVVVQLLL